MNNKAMTITSVLIFFSIILMPFAAAQLGPGGQMGPAPELGITGIQFSDANAIEGQDVTITVTIQNMNSTVAIGNITLSLYLDYVLLQNFTGIELGAGESASFDYIWQSESGTHNVSAVLSVGGIMLPATQVSEELTVSLGDVLSPVLAIAFLMLAIFVIAIIPSLITKFRG